jgi:Swiss Army Knife RNA repair-like protein
MQYPPDDSFIGSTAPSLTNRRGRQASEASSMLRKNEKPLLFLDIDGVLSLFGFASDSRPDGVWLNVDGIVHLISATAAEHLQRLGAAYEVVWCSGWEERANEHLVAALTLAGPLPFLTFPPNGDGRHWKLASIEAHALDRPLAWVDDAHDDSCHAWAAARAAPTLLVATQPPIGLTEAQVAALERWARVGPAP